MLRFSVLVGAILLSQTAFVVAADFTEGDPAREAATIAALEANSVFPSATNYREIESQTDEARKIPLTFILLKGSGWQDSQIIDQIRTAEQIYEPCGISFGPIVLVEAVTTYDLDNVGRPNDLPELTQEWANEFVPYDLRMAELDLPKPLLFLRKRGGAYSYNDSLIVDPYYEALRDTVFLTSFDVANHGDSLTAAHELAHVVFNEGHNETKGNVLACFGDDCTGTKISKKQCAAANSWWDRIGADPWAAYLR